MTLTGAKSRAAIGSDHADRSFDQMAPGRAAILRATIEVLEEQGEAAVKVAEIAKVAGVAVGLISRHFGSRDGLVAEAQFHRFRDTLTTELGLVKLALQPDTGYGEALAVYESALMTVLEPSRSAMRLQRMAILGAAHGRPLLLEHLREVQASLLDTWEAVLRAGQDVGRVNAAVSPRTAATLVLGSMFGLSMWDLDARQVPVDEIRSALAQMLTFVFNPSGV